MRVDNIFGDSLSLVFAARSGLQGVVKNRIMKANLEKKALGIAGVRRFTADFGLRQFVAQEVQVFGRVFDQVTEFAAAKAS